MRERMLQHDGSISAILYAQLLRKQTYNACFCVKFSSVSCSQLVQLLRKGFVDEAECQLLCQTLCGSIFALGVQGLVKSICERQTKEGNLHVCKDFSRLDHFLILKYEFHLKPNGLNFLKNCLIKFYENNLNFFYFLLNLSHFSSRNILYQ